MRSGLRRAVRNAGTPAGPRVAVGGSASGLSGMSGGNADLAMIRAYKNNGTNFANVSMLASSTASAAWGLFRGAPTGTGGARWTTNDQGSDQRPQVTVHAALNVLSSPANIVTQSGRRWPIWDQMGLFEISSIWLQQTGKCHWVVDTAEGAAPMPLGLWPVRPDRMIPVPDKDRYLAGWAYRAPGGETVPLYPDEVIFNRLPDPEDVYGGAGPIQAVLSDIEAAGHAAEWNKNYFINSADPGGILQLDHKFDDGEFDDLVNGWRETHRGVARAHRVAVLEAGVTFIPNSHAAKDMDFANLRNVMRDTIREALGMHKVMTGVSEDVNRANAQTGEEVFASWKVDPLLRRWRNVLNSQLLPLFGATAKGVSFDYFYPQPANREQDALELTTKANAALTLVSAGFDPAQVLVTVGLPSMDVAVRAAQLPALPPSWVAVPPAAPAESATALLDRVAQRQLAAWNSLAGAAA